VSRPLYHRRPKHYSVALEDAATGEIRSYCRHGRGEHSRFFAGWCHYRRTHYQSVPGAVWVVVNERNTEES
jgi:hypothetical protein